MKHIFEHPAVILAATIVAVSLAFSLGKSGLRLREAKQTVQNLQTEVNANVQDVLELQQSIQEVETEFFQEKTIRNELLLRKEGEYILQIPNPQVEGKNGVEVEKAPPQPAARADVSPARQWWEAVR